MLFINASHDLDENTLLHHDIPKFFIMHYVLVLLFDIIQQFCAGNGLGCPHHFSSAVNQQLQQVSCFPKVHNEFKVWLRKLSLAYFR